MIKHEITQIQANILYYMHRVYNETYGMVTFRDYCMITFRGKFKSNFSLYHGCILFENENDYTMFLLKL